MILFDVNVLLNAHRSGQEHRRVARGLLEDVVNAPAPFPGLRWSHPLR